jgi:hypothetical protein
MTRMLDLLDVLKLIINRLDEGATAQQDFVLQH